MSELFNVTLESGNLIGGGDAFDSFVNDGAQGSVEVAAALGGSGKGLQIVIDDTNAIYGTRNQAAPASDEIRSRAYFHTNGMTFGAGEDFIYLDVYCAGAPWALARINVGHTGASYEVGCSGFNDAGFISSDWANISDGEHYIEVHIERSTGVGDNNGRIRWWLDGVLQFTWNNVDNWDAFAILSSFKMGAKAGIDAGTSGTFYCDELKANDDGSEIGPRVAAPIMMYDYRRRRV